MKEIENLEVFPSLQSLATEWLTPKELENEIGIKIAQQEKMRMRKNRINNDIQYHFQR